MSKIKQLHSTIAGLVHFDLNFPHKYHYVVFKSQIKDFYWCKISEKQRCYAVFLFCFGTESHQKLYIPYRKSSLDHITATT